MIALTGCSPALNWREVPLGAARVMLPCKPDRAQRTVQLGEQPRVMEMVGCEAEGALFAASRIEAPFNDQAALQAQWHRASLVALGDTRQDQARAAANGASWAAEGQGRASDGSPVQARFLWQGGTNELILRAVYAPNVTNVMTEQFLSELKLP